MWSANGFLRTSHLALILTYVHRIWVRYVCAHVIVCASLITMNQTFYRPSLLIKISWTCSLESRGVAQLDPDSFWSRFLDEKIIFSWDFSITEAVYWQIPRSGGPPNPQGTESQERHQTDNRTNVFPSLKWKPITLEARRQELDSTDGSNCYGGGQPEETSNIQKLSFSLFLHMSRNKKQRQMKAAERGLVPEGQQRETWRRWRRMETFLWHV